MSHKGKSVTTSASTKHQEPLIPASTSLPEITLKVIILSIILAAVMSAANAYLALKIGQTISASIPASVLAIAVLRFFKNSNVLESNLIQTAASAGEGVAASIAFVLPAMIFIHAWAGFDYWETTAVTTFGGLLGVFFSIPLRRVMLNMKTLRFPEGTAVGNVLRITSMNVKGNTHMKRLVQGISIGGFMSFAQSGIQIFSDSIHYWFKSGKAVFGIALGFSPALFAAGYIVGIEVGASLFTGFVLGWVIVLPLLAMHFGLPSGKSVYHSVMAIWSSQLRFVGVGVMLVGGVWTLIRLIKPVIEGIKLSFVSLHHINVKGKLARTERDIPIMWAFFGVLICLLLFFMTIMHFAYVEKLFRVYSYPFLLWAGFITVLYLLIVGFFISTICAYFTGLVGSSNNPLSGLIILSILILGAIYFFLFSHHGDGKIAAMMVLVTAVVATSASISNENLQDLKAGQMVGATPWKQQLVLGIGVVVSAFVLAPVLELLFNAYGMGGVFPHSGMDPSQMLIAPQAGLMASVINGIRTQNLPWNMIIIGMLIAVLVIIADEILRKRGRRLPALAVGLGVYLPPSIILSTVLGSVVKFLATRVNNRAKTEAHKTKVADAEQSGLLLACGLVAGAALMGVVLAVPFVMMGSSNALSIMPDNLSGLAHAFGLISFLALAVWVYKISRYRK
ncbi:MAG: oligopeptide transporter, OPT family [Gammaproteobacteria bacterium CG_4_10_14_0_8_um_filter_38_16]|nr:MAG: oligopeptide transporter, OPT family [Gammaproteobacteria bacterium CG_4_10_14_0_8_um_filter_38_16]PJA03122.1 MAG: oligopeptide transporter, OPT family [Gammaproteobacteria bacterium CG_4_10_14_0_2_um_filter_38_22]PJB09932.1 MAG: oligopeptide transporter, OPT family [Gammaproteobacteria bacterium CG_4_9_14_3_um_filter_38_9]